ncbi:hypothetical protein [Celerinatantimonas sp. MCCC 1A17872]|uniref:hypothetical protein n=1 Tax=Celerinatantimonas sp. MCCC 1A17872 TaxID=3177514 RepID=UPI0038BFB94E
MMNEQLMTQIISDEVLNKAYQWVCLRRKGAKAFLRRLMNRSLGEVKQTKHPFKTYIRRINETGFDFLGYRLIPHHPLTPAGKPWPDITVNFCGFMSMARQYSALHSM